MTALMDEAMAAVQGKDRGMREAFQRLMAVFQRAEGQEKEEIGSMFEALQSSATVEDLAWMGDAWDQAGSRGDAAEGPEDDEAIDWERVNREAAAIVELNKDARSRWQQQEGPEEGEGERPDADFL